MAPNSRIIETDPGGRQFPRVEFPEALALALVLAVAALLRLHLLGQQSLWADEGNSWGMAIRPLAAIAPAAAGDIHPPLYYYLLNLWARLFGTSEAGLRSLSVLWGWLMVVVTYGWGRRVGGPLTGLAAGVLAAVSPFAIYYSQEARGYAQMACLAATAALSATVYLQARQAGASGRWPAVAYVAAAAALLWTHYLGFFMLFLLNGFALVWLLSRRARGDASREARRWVALQLAVAVLYLPWLPTMLGRAGAWPAISEPGTLSFYLGEAARLYSLGPAGNRLLPVAVVALLVAALGAIVGGRGSRGPMIVWLLVVAYAVWPPLALWLVSLFRPAYRAKFLLLGLPAFHVLLGAAAAWLAGLLWRRARMAPLAVVAGLLLLGPPAYASYVGLHAYYTDPAYFRDDYRAIAGFIDAAAGPGDAVILNAPGQVEVFTYYYHGPAKVYPLPLQRPATETAVLASLSQIAGLHEHVFAVLWATGESDPQSLVETWLDTNTYKAMDSWYGNVRLASYEIPAEQLGVREPDAVLGDSLTLVDYGTRGAAVTPGTAWPVVMHWRLERPVSTTYKVFLQALDANSNIVGQRDAELLAGGRPTSAWATGEVVVSRQAIPIHLGTPPGQYRVIAGLYDAGSGARLPLADGADHLELGSLTVAPAPRPVPIEALRPAAPARITLGPLRLLGWDAGPLGGSPGHTIAATPGQPLSLVFYWNVLRPASARLQYSIESPGNARVLGEQEVLQGYAAPSTWRAGDLLRDPHVVFLPPDLPGGHYRLSVRVTTPDGDGRVDLATVTVR